MSFTVTTPGIDVIVPDEAAARNLAIARLPFPAKILDINGKDVTQAVLKPRTFKGKVTITIDSGDMLVVPIEMFMVRGNDGIPGFITADIKFKGGV